MNIGRYPNDEWRLKIHNLLKKILLQASNGTGVSWDGSVENAFKMSDTKWSRNNFLSSLQDPASDVGKRIDRSKLVKGVLEKINTPIKNVCIGGQTPNDNDLAHALFDEFQYNLFDNGSRRLLIHRISKYEDEVRSGIKFLDTEFYSMCN